MSANYFSCYVLYLILLMMYASINFYIIVIVSIFLFCKINYTHTSNFACSNTNNLCEYELPNTIHNTTFLFITKNTYHTKLLTYLHTSRSYNATIFSVLFLSSSYKSFCLPRLRGIFFIFNS